MIGLDRVKELADSGRENLRKANPEVVEIVKFVHHNGNLIKDLFNVKDGRVMKKKHRMIKFSAQPRPKEKYPELGGNNSK